MLVSREQGSFLTLLTTVLGVRSAVEVGTFTGYSAICIARGLPAGGRLICIDINEEWATIARRYWKLAGVVNDGGGVTSEHVRATHADRIRTDGTIDG